MDNSLRWKIALVAGAIAAVTLVAANRNADDATPDNVVQGATTATTNSAKPTATGGKVIKDNGLIIEDRKVGSGAVATAGKTVKVHYRGTLQNGKVFDDSHKKEPISFILGTGAVIPGWDQGVEGMKVGGKRHLVIPSDLAYGEAGRAPVIPPNATLVFDVELVDVE